MWWCRTYNNTNNNPIYKAPKALASKALAAGQSWVLIKSLTEEVRLKPRFKYRQHTQSTLIIVLVNEFQTVGAEQSTK